MDMIRVMGISVPVILLALVPSVTLSAGRASTFLDAAANGDKAAVSALLQQHADVNAATADGATALHWAVYRDDKDLVELLIKAGANVKAASREGATPLWLASIGGDAAIIAALITAGADPNEQLPLGEDPPWRRRPARARSTR